jgi:hypothetical protein
LFRKSCAPCIDDAGDLVSFLHETGEQSLELAHGKLCAKVNDRGTSAITGEYRVVILDQMDTTTITFAFKAASQSHWHLLGFSEMEQGALARIQTPEPRL